jgi:N-acetylmuramoyl-L-alanine amidase
MPKGIIDAGHGGFDPGAVGPTGVQEKVITLAVAKKAAEVLRGAGVDVLFTRDSDKLLAGTINADLGMRYKIANQAKADVFVSIHCNSAADPKANGTETFYCTGSPAGAKLAEHIQNRLITALGLRNRGVKSATFAVLRGTNMPAALVELAFISNPTEEGLLETPAFQDKAALAIADGVLDFLNIKPQNASATTKISVGGKVLNGMIMDESTWAPVREFANALGYPVSWDAQKGVTVGGIKIDVRLVDGVSYAPVRYLAESLGKKVSWDAASRKVVII